MATLQQDKQKFLQRLTRNRQFLYLQIAILLGTIAFFVVSRNDELLNLLLIGFGAGITGISVWLTLNHISELKEALAKISEAEQKANQVLKPESLALAPALGLAIPFATRLLVSFFIGVAGTTTGTIKHLGDQSKQHMAEYITVLKDTGKDVNYRVRFAIALQRGYDPPDTSKCKPERSMADFSFDDTDILDLTRSFNYIVGSAAHQSLCSATDVKQASKVKDCIKLVKKAINPAAP
jgi:hypothetical protein